MSSNDKGKQDGADKPLIHLDDKGRVQVLDPDLMELVSGGAVATAKQDTAVGDLYCPRPYNGNCPCAAPYPPAPAPPPPPVPPTPPDPKDLLDF